MSCSWKKKKKPGLNNNKKTEWSLDHQTKTGTHSNTSETIRKGNITPSTGTKPVFSKATMIAQLSHRSPLSEHQFQTSTGKLG